MDKIKVKVFTVDRNEWISETPTHIEFIGELIVEHHGPRGEAIVYRTRRGQLAIVHDHDGVKGKVLMIHPDLQDVARFTEGYTRVKTPWYDEGIIEAITDALDQDLPTQRIDI